MYSLNLLAIALELAHAEPGLRGRRQQVLGALPLHRARDEQHGHRTAAGSVGRGRRLLLRRAAHCRTAQRVPLKVRSMVGLIPLFAVETLEPELLERLPGFKRRLDWFLAAPARPDRQRRLHAHAAATASGGCCRSSTRERLRRVLRVHARRERVPLAATASARSRACTASIPTCCTSTAPTTASTTSRRSRRSGLFGGNSNWRGPIWFPVNYLLIEALQKFHHYFGDDFKVECPTGSGMMMTLWEVAAELSRRLSRIFLRDADGRRPVVRRRRALPDRSALARPHPVPRVLPRRQRRRPRRQPPDRLDRARREAAPAGRTVAAAPPAPGPRRPEPGA